MRLNNVSTFMPFLCGTLNTPFFSKSQMTMLFYGIQEGKELINVRHESLASEAHFLNLANSFGSNSKAIEKRFQVCGFRYVWCLFRNTKNLNKISRQEYAVLPLYLRNGHNRIEKKSTPWVTISLLDEPQNRRPISSHL